VPDLRRHPTSGLDYRRTAQVRQWLLAQLSDEAVQSLVPGKETQPLGLPASPATHVSGTSWYRPMQQHGAACDADEGPCPVGVQL